MDYIKEIADIFNTVNYHDGDTVTRNNITIEASRADPQKLGEAWLQGFIPTCMKRKAGGLKIWFVPVDELDKTSHHVSEPPWMENDKTGETEEFFESDKTHECLNCEYRFNINPVEYSGCPNCRSREVEEI